MALYWKDVNGRNWPVCICLKEWLTAYQNELLRVGEIKHGLDLYQTIGNAPASAGYHAKGGNVDTGQRSIRAVRIARNMGGAAWSRGPADGMTPHCHITLKSCPHNPAGPRWQVTELEAGRNGLVNRKADNGPRSGIKWPLRSFTAGIAWAKAQKPAKPPKPSTPWHSCAFLNTHGDDGSTGTKTYFNRLPQMVVDVTKGKPDVIALCEVTAEQEKVTVKTMKNAGYKLVGYEHRLALFALPAVKIGAVSFTTYRRQNKGAIEGILRARLTVNGSRVNYGVTHLDYRSGFDAGRVAQMKEGIAAMRRFGLTLLPSWKSRTVILGDFNSETWVVDKALKPAGFEDVGAGADIDFITVGDERPIGKVGHLSTQSDHPVIRAELRKYA